MLNLGLTEILVIAFLAIVVVGPERLPAVLRFLGQQYGRLMRASFELRRAFMMEADQVEAQRRVQALDQARRKAMDRVMGPDHDARGEE